MRLQDIKDGKVTITEHTSITHNGQVYRGLKAINQLVDNQTPISQPQNEVQNDAADTTSSDAGNGTTTNPAPAAARPAPKKATGANAKTASDK